LAVDSTGRGLHQRPLATKQQERSEKERWGSFRWGINRRDNFL